MESIPIQKVNAINAWNKADASGKKLLEELLGKENLSGNIQDIIKNFEDILAISGQTMETVARPGDTPDEVAYKQAKLIAAAYNQGRVLDPNNPNQYKYYPWHEVVKTEHPSGFGLSYLVFVGWYSSSTVGVRLCFVDSEDAIDAGKKFIEIYENLKIR